VVVVPRDVPVQGPALADPGQVEQRQHGRHEAVIRLRHQVGGAVIGQQLAEQLLVRREMSGNVHLDPSSPRQG
jgi:hypothetical protein